MDDFFPDVTEGDDGGRPEDSVHGVTGRGGALTGRGTEKFLWLPPLLTYKGKTTWMKLAHLIYKGKVFFSGETGKRF